MRSIPQSILDELAGKELVPFYLLDMDINGTHYRYTECDVPIVYDSNVYSSHTFKAEAITYTSETIVNSFEITIDNIQGTLLPLFESGNAQGSTCQLYVAVLDASDNFSLIAAVMIFEGTIDDWHGDEEEIQFIVSNIFNQWKKNSTSRHPPSCRWREFKGSRCGYPGSATNCDRSYATCENLGNTDNFGGFRWLPAITDKVFWWGRWMGYQE